MPAQGLVAGSSSGEHASRCWVGGATTALSLWVRLGHLGATHRADPHLSPASQLRDTILYENDANVAPSRRRAGLRAGAEAGSGGSRGRGDARPSLAARVAAMQRDSATYCSQPADGAAFEAFMATFSVEVSRPISIARS